MHQGINDRIREARRKLGKTQAEFAQALGFSQSGISALENGDRNILEKHIKTIASIYHIDETWLRTGKGEMMAGLPEPAKKCLPMEMALSKDETDLLRAFLSFPVERRAQIIHFAQELARKYFEQKSLKSSKKQSIKGND